MRLVIVCILLVFIGGCAYAPIAIPVIGYSVASMIASHPLDYQCQIRSNTSWSGTFTAGLDTYPITGVGDTIVTFEDALSFSASLQKQTTNGYLLLRVIPFDDGNICKESTVYTTASQGKVRICLP
jgi:hypothetical protein